MACNRHRSGLCSSAADCYVAIGATCERSRLQSLGMLQQNLRGSKVRSCGIQAIVIVHRENLNRWRSLGLAPTTHGKLSLSRLPFSSTYDVIPPYCTCRATSSLVSSSSQLSGSAATAVEAIWGMCSSCVLSPSLSRRNPLLSFQQLHTCSMSATSYTYGLDGAASIKATNSTSSTDSRGARTTRGREQRADPPRPIRHSSAMKDPGGFDSSSSRARFRDGPCR